MDDGKLRETKEGTWRRGDIGYIAYFRLREWPADFRRGYSYAGVAEREDRAIPSGSWMRESRRECPHRHPTTQEALECAQGMIIDAEVIGGEEEWTPW